MWWALQILWAWPLIASNGAGIKVTMRNNEACINRDWQEKQDLEEQFDVRDW